MKTWDKPKLIALVRSKPQETVLQVCKFDQSQPWTGPGANQEACFNYFPGIGCVLSGCSQFYTT